MQERYLLLQMVAATIQRLFEVMTNLSKEKLDLKLKLKNVQRDYEDSKNTDQVTLTNNIIWKSPKKL